MSLRSSRWSFRATLAACAGALALLAGCGGDVYEPFRPDRAISFGDEYSYIRADGRKYTYNYLEDLSNPATSLNCSANPVWNQIVVEEEYGFSFTQCNRGGRTGNAVAQLYAAEKAKIGDIAKQIDDFLSRGNTLSKKDLILLQGGANDIWEIWENAGHTVTDASRAEARARGAALGAQINRLTAMDARVLSIDVPYQGSTPKAFALTAATPVAYPNAPTDLNVLTDEFNSGFYFSFPTNSRKAAYAQVNSLVRRIMNTDDSSRPYKFRDVTTVSCVNVPSALECTNTTLLGDASPVGDNWNYVFADERFFTPTVNRLMGNLARDRADEHPF